MSPAGSTPDRPSAAPRRRRLAPTIVLGLLAISALVAFIALRAAVLPGVPTGLGFSVVFAGPDALPVVEEGAERASQGASGILLSGAAPAELELWGRERIGSVVLAAGREAPARLVVEGARLGERLLRPDGGVEFELLLDPPVVAREGGWLRPPLYGYRLVLSFGEELYQPLALRWRRGDAEAAAVNGVAPERSER